MKRGVMWCELHKPCNASDNNKKADKTQPKKQKKKTKKSTKKFAVNANNKCCWTLTVIDSGEETRTTTGKTVKRQ